MYSMYSTYSTHRRFQYIQYIQCQHVDLSAQYMLYSEYTTYSNLGALSTCSTCSTYSIHSTCSTRTYTLGSTFAFSARANYCCCKVTSPDHYVPKNASQLSFACICRSTNTCGCRSINMFRDTCVFPIMFMIIPPMFFARCLVA